MASAQSTASIREVWPLMLVQDLEKSLVFYRDLLGFNVEAESLADGKVFWCRISRGQVSLMLQQAEAEDGPAQGRGRGVGLYLVCDEIDTLFQEFTRRGVVIEPPSVTYYGMKQFLVPDPDGYFVCFECSLPPH